ncbi:hypothetical protein Glove_851g15 [Diversispora epigaea]|uniref:Protein kinase domain-containing protein n=1 Tax=Diversispora epigaea TaxID=1348612 RepID=A0A397FYL5_9GLOM|nr:hypothetical protein Glove_851g15 [Diversispora epigaea]
MSSLNTLNATQEYDKRCNAMNLLIVDSCNKNIDYLIRETQFTKVIDSEFLEWVPYTCQMKNPMFWRIGKIHYKKIHSGNFLIIGDYTRISDLGLSQPENIDSNLSRKSQMYGIIPYMAPELFKGQIFSYTSDIYSLGMIMWELTSGHRPFHDQEHGPKLVLDILNGKRPEITEDTPECWANLMKGCEFWRLLENFNYDHPDMWIKFNEAEKKRCEMVKSKKPFVQDMSIPILDIISISSTISGIFYNDNLFSDGHFDIIDIKYNSNEIGNSDGNSSSENSKKHFLDELQEITDQSNILILKRRKISEYLADNVDINSLYFCLQCLTLVVNSGNKNIDDLIKESQSPKYGNPLIRWVPYEKFTNIEYIGKGGFSQIYKATWERNYGIERVKTEVVLKVLNESRNVNEEFLKEFKHINKFNIREIIECYGVTQDPITENYAFILEYVQDGDLHHFIRKHFEVFTWKKKITYLTYIAQGIEKIHNKKIIHRDLHSGNILIIACSIRISDLGFSQPANIKPNLSRKSQIYGIIPYMAPELFNINHIHMHQIIWQLTSGHRPFRDQEHECWANLMKRCWHSDPSQRPTIKEIDKLSEKFYNNCWYSENRVKEYYPVVWLNFNEAEKKRCEMVKSKKPFVKNPGYVHPNSRYYSTLLNPISDSSNSSVVENSRKRFLDESPQEEIIEDQK